MGLFKSFSNLINKSPVLVATLGLLFLLIVVLNLMNAYVSEPEVVGYEGFADEAEEAEGAADAEEEIGGVDEAAEEDKAEPFADEMGGRPKKMKGHRHNRDRKQNFRLGQKQGDADDDVHLDAGTTALLAFNKLSPDQVRMMRNDTQELVRTQKELMDTFKSMAPMLEEGRKLMDTFGGQMKE